MSLANIFHRAPTFALVFERQAKTKLLVAIQREFQRIKSRCIYLDTVQILTAKPLSSAQLALVRTANAPGAVVMMKSKRPGYFLVRMHQPSRGSANVLSAFAPDHIISRADFALDLSVEHFFGARRLHFFLSRYLRQTWHGNRKIVSEQNTLYFDKAWNRRNIVMYASRPSKITGTACAHVEFRFYGARICKRNGLRTLTDLRKFDAISLLQKSFRLSAVVPSLVDKRINSTAGTATLIHNRKNASSPLTRSQMGHIIRRMLARLLETAPGDIMRAPIQRWFEYHRKFVRRAVVDAPRDALVNRYESHFLF